MEIEVEKLIENALRDGIREGIKAMATRTYENPITKLIDGAIAKNSAGFQVLLGECIGSCIADQKFRDEIATAVRHQLAKTLVQRFGGELEKQVNVLKSDPTTRARITLAIEEIVKAKTTA